MEREEKGMERGMEREERDRERGRFKIWETQNPGHYLRKLGTCLKKKRTRRKCPYEWQRH